MVKLIVALGNPGPDYEKTRHNIGQMVLEKLSFFNELNWSEKFKGRYSSYNIRGNKVYFLIPMTWMNLSGDSVAPMAKFFKISMEEILLVYDEIDLDFGTIVLKRDGGLAGHNGLKSVAKMLGGQGFKRLRVGISRPQVGEVSSWVLSPFSQKERDVLGTVLETASHSLEYCLNHGFEGAITKFGRRNCLDEIS